MSSSSQTGNLDASKVTGRVIVGMGDKSNREMTIQEVEGRRKLVWDDKVNDEYLERVKAMAQEKAKEILAEAMREAEELKANAHAQGLEEGRAQAQQEQQQYHDAMSQTIEGMLANLQAQGQDIWASRSMDCVYMIRLAIEKILNISIDHRREEIMSNLLHDAISKLEEARTMVVRCSPQDAELIGSMFDEVKQRNPGLSHWKVQNDPSIQGGVVIETEEGRSDNTLAARWAAVEPVLDQMVVMEEPPAPEGE